MESLTNSSALNPVKEESRDEWDTLYEDINAIDIKVDHIKILDKITTSSMIGAESLINLEKKVEASEYKNYKICPVCDIRCKICEHKLICENCGLERDWQDNSVEGYSISVDQNYNTSQNSYVSFNLIGAGAYCYQRSFLKTCADYSSFRNNSNKKEITNIIYQHEGSKPPVNVINAAAELFDAIIQSGRVYRKNGKRGVMAACLYYSCVMHNVTRTPHDIASIMNTEERFLSQGDRALQELNELGIIEIPTNYEPVDDYLNQFFPALGIPDKYKAFISDIIIRAEKKHLHVKNECRTTTKCIGAIFLLTKRVKELRHIKKDAIVRECNNISKSTFLKYYNLLCMNHKLLKKSFKRHGIPMPAAWKY